MLPGLMTPIPAEQVGRVPVATRHNVRVDLQRDDRARVAEPLRHDVHRHPGSEQDRRVRVPQVVQPDRGRRRGGQLLRSDL